MVRLLVLCSFLPEALILETLVSLDFNLKKFLSHHFVLSYPIMNFFVFFHLHQTWLYFHVCFAINLGGDLCYISVLSY